MRPNVVEQIRVVGQLGEQHHALELRHHRACGRTARRGDHALGLGILECRLDEVDLLVEDLFQASLDGAVMGAQLERQVGE